MSLQKNVIGSWRGTVNRFCTHLATTTKTSCCRCISVTRTILCRSGVKLVTYLTTVYLTTYSQTGSGHKYQLNRKWLHWFLHFMPPLSNSLHYVHPCVRDNTQNLLGLVGCLYMPPRARICPKSLFGILGVQIIQILPWSKLELENLTTLHCLCFGQPKICKVCLLRPKGQLVCLIFQTQTWLEALNQIS